MRSLIMPTVVLSLWSVNAQAIEWQWIGADTAVVSSATEAFNSDGSPINLVNISDRLDAQLLDDFYGMLPEGMAISDELLNETFKNLSIREDLPEGETVTVKLAFLNEGAGYRNALGYFIYETSNPPTSVDEVEHVLIMPNSSKQNSGGSLTTGDQIDLMVSLTAGQTIGFFVNSNGWDWSYGSQRSEFTFGQPFYTLTDLNPTAGLGQQYHVVLYDSRSQTDEGSGFFAYGFEDILTSGGDADFNDLIFDVEISDVSALADYDKVKTLPSVTAQVDVKAGVLAFEDNWPMTDDYDFNDAVIGYQITKTHDLDNEHIKTIEIDYDIKAIGATFHNGIALTIPGLSESMIESVTLEKTINGVSILLDSDSQVITYTGSANEVSYDYPLIKDSEYGDIDAAFTLSEDLFEELSTFDSNGMVHDTNSCMFKTTTDSLACGQGTTSATMKLTIEINSGALARDAIGTMPFDHYMFSTYKNDLYRYGRNNGETDWYGAWQNAYANMDAAQGPGPGKYLEIHMKQYSSGTNVFEPMFSVSDEAAGMLVDAQPYDEGNPFISSEITRNGKLTGNLPWVLDLPVGWQHPKERIDISKAYPNFYLWAEDNSVHGDWYESDINENALFSE